tara:strand:+ start:783 stop:1514 length:732 start_codon:yes stop_codon:yes gene_type:complete
MQLPNILILAGGKAKRLGRVSKNLPKSLINFYGIPFLYYQLKLLEKSKFKKIVISTGYLSKQIEVYINSIKSKFNFKIVFSDDGKKSLGTGGAIKKTLPLLSKNFFVIFGDSFLDVNYLKIYKNFLKSKKLGLITIYKNNNLSDSSGEGFSDVEINNGEIINYDKKKKNPNMKYINYGISVFNKSLFKQWKFEKRIDLQLIHQKLIKNKKLEYLIIKKPFYEIGSRKGITLTKKYFKQIHKFI